MNTLENKRMLWDCICEMNVFRPGMKRDTAVALFEETIVEIDSLDKSLIEKNKFFMKVYIQNLNKIVISETDMKEYRETLFEERLANIQNDKTLPLHNIFDPIDVHAELVHIKSLLHKILDKL
jgi:hypothetical protein